ncbi:MAG: hypothetical protein JWM99_1025 [Verrucomicrobiales bacterium]|nr:hypothetical protein [Verrucomicrobiales bacterium]
MKIKCITCRSRAFTLPEIMVTSALLLMVVAGMLTGHLFGIRMFQITKAKLGASDDARRAVGELINDIRSGKIIKVGTGTISNFTEVGFGAREAGSAIQIYGNATNTNAFTRYFLDTDNRLKRTTNGSTAVSVVASFVTNSVIFTSEDESGTVISNNLNNRVIGMMLQFYQIQYPIVKVGPGNFYEYYQLSSKVTRRTHE